jgi:hypothetical protein
MITSVPHTACDDEHSEGQDGSDDGAAYVCGFSFLFSDG